MSAGARITVLGVVFLALFGVLTLRLWTVQVTATTEYQTLAESNQVRVVETPAPRGEIRDRNGDLIAGTRSALAAVLDGALVPDEDDPGEPDFIQRLSTLSGIPVDEVREAVAMARSRADRITLIEELTSEQAVRLIEYAEDYPGVSVLPQPVRIYPEGALAGHLLGYIGDPNEDDIAKPGISPTDRVGRAGVERQYDDQLRGTPGAIKYRIDAQQNVLDVIGEQAPSPGDNLVLTVDLDVQRILEWSLASGLQAARAEYDPDCSPTNDPRCPVRAVGVVLDVTDGSVVAMSSVPGYDPNLFVDGVSQREWDRLSALSPCSTTSPSRASTPRPRPSSPSPTSSPSRRASTPSRATPRRTTPPTSATVNSSSASPTAARRCSTTGSPAVTATSTSTPGCRARATCTSGRSHSTSGPTAAAPKAAPSPRTCSRSGLGCSASTSPPASTSPSSRPG